MSEEENEKAKVEKGMADFHRRTLDRLPVISPANPFEVKVDIQSVPSVPFKNDNFVPIVEYDTKSVGGPPPVGITSVTPNVVSSAGGTTVTISGSNFVNGATVKIGGIPATSVVYVNPSTLTCVTPADGLGWLTVEVTNPTGQPASLANAINYVNWPDNVLLEGPIVQRSDLYSGYPYPYKITIRLGSVPFTPPTGTIVYVGLVVRSPFGYYSQLGYQNFGTIDIVAPGGSYLAFDNSSGPSKNITIQVNSSPVHTNGYVDVGAYLAHGSETGVLPLAPIYGDPSHQPTAFRIIMDVNGPYPPSVPTNDHFSWEDLGKVSGGAVGTWGWVSGDNKNLRIRRIKSDGTLNATFNGTAALTWSRIGSTVGQLSIDIVASVTFVSGIANLTVRADYTYHDSANSQGFGYFSLHATDGPVVGSTGTCACLNHL